MTLFTVNETAFGWEEIVAAAEAWGEWPRLVERTRQALGCLAYAAKTGQLPSGKEVRAAATAFRYARNLISADEASAWLNAWEMTADEWMNYLRGQWLAERYAEKLDEIVTTHPISDDAVAAVIKHYAICSGLFNQWAQELAGRAALAAQSGLPDGAAAAGVASPHDVIARIETAFAAQREAALTPQRLQASIANHRLDWVRFECRYLQFADEHIAREAAWCITEDGLTLDEVAADAHRTAQAQCFYLDELDAAVRPYFLAARQGEGLGPLKLHDGFSLFSIVSKQLPCADDPHIRQRAETNVIASLMSQAINERVRFAQQAHGVRASA